MSWNEMPAAYKFCILLVVMAVATAVGMGDWVIAGILLAIALVVFLVYSMISKPDTESSGAKSTNTESQSDSTE